MKIEYFKEHNGKTFLCTAFFLQYGPVVYNFGSSLRNSMSGVGIVVKLSFA